MNMGIAWTFDNIIIWLKQTNLSPTKLTHFVKTGAVCSAI